MSLVSLVRKSFALIFCLGFIRTVINKLGTFFCIHCEASQIHLLSFVSFFLNPHPTFRHIRTGRLDRTRNKHRDCTFGTLIIRYGLSYLVVTSLDQRLPVMQPVRQLFRTRYRYPEKTMQFWLMASLSKMQHQ